jgi:hypothetical protein
MLIQAAFFILNQLLTFLGTKAMFSRHLYYFWKVKKHQHEIHNRKNTRTYFTAKLQFSLVVSTN